MGYVYFIKAEGMEMYKIGRSEVADARLKTLQAGSPVMLTLLKSVHCDDAAIEKLLHDFMGSKRSHNEWFRLEDSDVKTVLAILDNPLGAEKIIQGKKNETRAARALAMFKEGHSQNAILNALWNNPVGRAKVEASREFNAIIRANLRD